MGLDMFLYCNSKRVCQEVNDMDDEWEGGWQMPRGVAIQWRKANAIHKWFVDNIQWGVDDCKAYDVEIGDLVRLRDTCKEVLDSTRLVAGTVTNGTVFEDGKAVPLKMGEQVLEDPSTAMELLPTKDGFFFGSTDYDQWYWWDLDFTLRKLDSLLENLEPCGPMNMHVIHKDEPDWFVKFRYTSSW